MSSLNPKKMKVAELKKELESRNISISKNMKKADLMGLLMSALDSESGQDLELSSSEAANDSQESVTSEPQAAEDSIANQDSLELNEECSKPVATDVSTTAQDEPDVTEVAPASENVEDQNNEATINTTTELIENSGSEAKDFPEDHEMQDTSANNDVENIAKNENLEKPAALEEEPKPKEEEQKESPEESVKEESPPPVEGISQRSKDEISLPIEKEVSQLSGNDVTLPAQDKTALISPENSSEQAHDVTEASSGQSQSRKRRHDDRGTRYNKMDYGSPPPEEEPEDNFDENLVVLDTYQADLNFKISRDRTGGQPFTMEGFAYLWAGAKATHGVSKGKVCFECKITEEDAVRHLPSDEPHPRVVRVGWSAESSGLQLGEEKLSFGYGGTGKFSVERNFTDFGESFHEGDVVGCFIDFSDDKAVSFAFSKNGNYLGVACTKEKSESNLVFFPHVLCKNSSIELNFGQKSEPFFNLPDEVKDFVFVSNVPEEDRVRALKGPASKSECEVLMMCGLPGAGKTYYSNQLMKEHPEKRYNVLGTNAIMDKMRVMGVSRKQNYASRWELLIHNATQCLNRLLQIACRKRRNYIVDQTNVYASAQRRKMRPFMGFQRKAIVIVPTEEEYKSRFDKRTEDEGKEVPEMAILEMKANFTLPEKGNFFDEIIFTELDNDEAEKLVAKYREEGAKNAPPPEKRARVPSDNRHRGRMGGWRQQHRFRPPPRYGPMNPWNRFGGRGPMDFPRAPYGHPMHGRGGGFGSRQPNYGRSRDYSRGDRRDNQNRDGNRGSNRNKGWQDHGNQNKIGYTGFNRQNPNSGSTRNQNDASSQGQYRGQGNATATGKFQQTAASQSVTPQSAQGYSYGNNQQYNTSNNMAGYSATGYNYSQQSMGGGNQMQQQGYQQSAYNQQDYSQQWMQFYQQQAQTQQYQNYYANYQQYYNQQQTYPLQQQQQQSQQQTKQ